MTGRRIVGAAWSGLALGVLLYGCAVGEKPKVDLTPEAQPLVRPHVTALLPPGGAVAGWSSDGEIREFAGRKVFDLIDGAAEVHLTYNFITVATADYTNDKDQYVTVSIYQLASPEDAYGLNSYYSPTQGRPSEVGCDSKVRLGSCRYWKGPYFVAVEGDPLAELDSAAEAFGRWVAERIPDKCPPPELVAVLPEGGRKTKPPIFLHKPLILTGLTFQAVATNPEALGLNERTDMAVAEYEGGFALSITRYPQADAARQAAEVYGPLLDRRAMLAQQKGCYLVATTAASDQARAALEEALSRLKP